MDVQFFRTHAIAISYAVTIALALALTMLCAAGLFLQRRLCAHLPHWRVLCWRRCAECLVLPRVCVHSCGVERAAAVLLERFNAGWEWYSWVL